MEKALDFFTWKKKLLGMMEQSAKLAEKCGYEVSAEKIMNIRKAFQEKELMVVAVGEARRGKSSMMNALLNEKEPLFPVDIVVTTNVVTIVRYGEKEKITAVLEHTDAAGRITQERKEISRGEIADYVSETGNPDNIKNVSMLEIELPNDLLQKNVVFVDTPGVGSMNIHHAQVTYGFLPNADLLLFTGDSSAGFTQTELKFLKQGYEHCKNVLFPLTKMDLNENYMEIAEDNRKKIHAAIGIPEDEIEVIPVSTSSKLRWLETGKERYYKNSNYESLESAIWESIARVQADRLLIPYVWAVADELGRVQEGIAAQYQMLHADKGKSKELAEELKAEKNKLEQLQSDSADWRRQLSTFFSEKGSGFNFEIHRLKVDLKNLMDETFAEKKEEICTKENYMLLLSELNDMISQRILDMKKKYEEEVVEKLLKIRGSLGLHLEMNRKALDKIGFEPDETLEITFRERKMADKVIGKGRKIGMNAMGGSYLGMVGGAIVGGAVGLLCGGVGVVPGVMYGAAIGGGIGTAGGAAKGSLEALNQYDEVDVQQVRKAFGQYVDLSADTVSQSLTLANQQMNQDIRYLLDTELQKRIWELQENIALIKQNINTSAKELPVRKKALAQQNAEVKNTLMQWDQAVDGIGRQKGLKGFAGGWVQAVDASGAGAVCECDVIGTEPGTGIGNDEASPENTAYDFL